MGQREEARAPEPRGGGHLWKLELQWASLVGAGEKEETPSLFKKMPLIGTEREKYPGFFLSPTFQSPTSPRHWPSSSQPTREAEKCNLQGSDPYDGKLSGRRQGMGPSMDKQAGAGQDTAPPPFIHSLINQFKKS